MVSTSRNRIVYARNGVEDSRGGLLGGDFGDKMDITPSVKRCQKRGVNSTIAEGSDWREARSAIC